MIKFIDSCLKKYVVYYIKYISMISYIVNGSGVIYQYVIRRKCGQMETKLVGFGMLSE